MAMRATEAWVPDGKAKTTRDRPAHQDAQPAQAADPAPPRVPDSWEIPAPGQCPWAHGHAADEADGWRPSPGGASSSSAEWGHFTSAHQGASGGTSHGASQGPHPWANQGHSQGASASASAPQADTEPNVDVFVQLIEQLIARQQQQQHASTPGPVIVPCPETEELARTIPKGHAPTDPRQQKRLAQALAAEMRMRQMSVVVEPSNVPSENGAGAADAPAEAPAEAPAAASEGSEPEEDPLMMAANEAMNASMAARDGDDDGNRDPRPEAQRRRLSGKQNPPAPWRR